MSAPLPRRPRLAAVSIAVAVAAGLSLTLAATPSTALPEPVGSTSTLHDAGGSGQGPVTPVRSAKSFGAASAQVSAPQLTRDQVLDRASDWVGKGIPYNQGAYYAGYRTDCSGYASMAWDLSSSLDTTSFVPSGTAHWITKADLKPGDALLNDSGGNSGHIALFAGWTDSSQSRYWAYEFTGSGVHYRQVPYPYFSGYGTFKPVRADNVIDDPAPTPAVSTVTAPSAGDILSGTVTLSAKVTDTVGTVTGALFYVDGELVGKDTSGPGGSYSVSLDTATTLSEGEHTLTVKGTNSAGQTGAASPGVSFFVANFAAASRTTGDFNGDGKDDIAVLYNYGQDDNSNYHTSLFTFTSTGSGFAAPVKVWDSGTGSWNWNRSKAVTGDFNGDGKDDIGVLYNYSNVDSALWTFTSTGTGFADPVKNWQSGEGNWNWDRSKVVSGDFTGDGKSDIGVLYNYGNVDSALFTFASTGSGFADPVKNWESGEGNWNWDRSKLVAGDFNGDGKADVGALYNYGNVDSALFTFASTGSGFSAPVKNWQSGQGNWNWDRSKLVAGDFNGDGKADVGALYNYSNVDSAVFTFTSTGSGFGAPVKKWDSGVGGWNWDRTKLDAGDFNGDGKADIGALYNYGNVDSAVWRFTSTGTSFSAPVKNWESGEGNWNWDRSNLT